MASTYTTSLKIQQIGAGEQSGYWGTTTNTNWNLIEQAVAGVQTITMANANYTLSNLNGVSDEARNMVLNIVGTNSAIYQVIIPANQPKFYIISNNTTGGYAITVGTTGVGGTLVSIPNGVTAQVYTDGTNTYSAQTGSAGPFYVNGTLTATGLTDTGNMSVGGTLGVTGAATLATVSATNLTATTLTATGTTTLNTGLTGLAKLTSGVVSAATAGTDYVVPSTATTYTALQTFAGSSSVAALKTSNIKEVATVSATAATSTINFDLTTQSVIYYTSNAAGNWTLNFRGSSGTSLDSIMSTGESMSATFLVTQGGTAYYNSAVTIDGNSVTPKWQSGVAPSAGNASSVDVYSYVIIKTGSATFTVLASQTKFA